MTCGHVDSDMKKTILTSISLVEPQIVVNDGASWGENAVDVFYQGSRMCWPSGCVGESTLVTTNYIGPLTVSFQGIAV